MARRTAQQRSWREPKKDFAAVDLDAKGDDKKVERSPRRDDDRPSTGRRPGDGRSASDVLDRRGMSRAVQKRIARARAEGERIERNRYAEQQAADQRELADLRKRLHGIEVSSKVSAEEQKHDAEMKELETALEKAHTDGNHAEIARITREMQQKATTWENRKRELLNTPVQQQQRQTTQPKGPTPEGRAWTEANADWYDKPGYEIETQAAIDIDQRLIAGGSDPNSPEHYRKIQKELNKRFRSIKVVSPDDDEDDDVRARDRDRYDDDELDDRDRDDEDEGADEDDDDERDDEDDDEDDDMRDRQRQRPASLGFESADSGRRRGTLKVRNGRIVLTAKDRENMEKFNMDPENDKHVEQWARTKRELADRDED